ncbi:MAG: DUF1841 family protein [Gammaproteobacteria bacterium]
MIQDRESSRRFFVEVWRKYRNNEALEPIERVLTEIILQHPEYHAELESGEDVLAADYTPEGGVSNPFLHMGMHVAIHEQVSTDRPAGIRDLYRTLLEKYGDAHQLEHAMMECLGEALWEAQRNNLPPDEQAYLECLRRL